MLKVYTNESVNVAITEGLKRRGVKAWSARDTGNLGMPDKEQFRYACEKKAVIVTMDDDFLSLVHKWSQERKEHYGIVYMSTFLPTSTI
ncbi:DUF5615 family PIN-like protein [candidate division WOR-3 bacterium]|nr:DUF5615 family PIN-like protein [candidate division WOR-3 bacterium]